MKLLHHNFFQILCFAYLLETACFASTKSGHIDFDDPFYAQTLKASIDEIYLTEFGETPEYIRTLQQKLITEEAQLAQKEYAAMVDTWYEPNLPVEAYHEAAYFILTHLELNEKTLLTFGTIAKKIGTPDEVYFNGYCSDDNGTIASFERFTARYKQKDIDIDFSVSGFCHSISVASSIFGGGKPRWPQTYSYSETLPITYGIKQKDKRFIDLTQAIDTIKLEKSSYWDWVGYMEDWPTDFKKTHRTCEVNIMLIDQICDDLAMVVLEVEKKKVPFFDRQETLYCNTWWKQKAGKWTLLNDEEVTQYFKPERTN